MAAIYLNPENLQNCVKALRMLAQDCQNAKGSISNSSRQLGDPYSKIGEFEVNVGTASNAVIQRADTVENIKNKIVRLNECGIATKNDSTGTITCNVPPEVTIENGSGEFTMWAQGAIDAHDLQKHADGDSDNEPDRTYEEIVASMEANASNRLYSVGFIDTVGGENLAKLPWI